MKIKNNISDLVLILFTLMGLACAEFPNKGIELGNPDELEGKAITVGPGDCHGCSQFSAQL